MLSPHRVSRRVLREGEERQPSFCRVQKSVTCPPGGRGGPMWRQQLKPGGDEGDMVKMSQDLFKPLLDSLAWRRRDRESSMD